MRKLTKILNEERDVVVYDEYGPVRMIRSHEWKYVHRYPYGPHELYDLKRDPGEKKNLIDSPKHESTVIEFRKRLRSWFATYVDPTRDGVQEPVTGAGQDDLCGPYGTTIKTFVKIK